MIEFSGVNKTYRNGKLSLHALKDISLTIEQGEFVAIMGASGSGKSTLLHILGFLDPPDNGSYRFFGVDVSRLHADKLAQIRNQVAGFIFQQFHLLPGVTALENVNLPQIYARKPVQKDEPLRQLTAVGLKDRVQHVPNELSGGERQRVAIARALVNNPAVLFADEPTGNLDTASEAEIMAILKDLHSKGLTIVMVTHEHEIAAQAERIITMRDGRIVSDQKRSGAGKRDLRAQHSRVRGILQNGQKKSLFSELLSHLRQAWHSIGINKLRTFLSMLGILIGVASVITMLALGAGATRSIKQDLSALGSNLLMIRTGARSSGSVSLGRAAYSRLTLQDARSLEKIKSIRSVSAQVTGRGQAQHGNKNWNTYIMGVAPSYARMHDSLPVLGRFHTGEETMKREKVAVIGPTIARELFGENSPLGATIKINRVNFRVIGVLPDKGFSRGRDSSDIILVPLNTAMYRLLGKQYIDTIEAEIISEDRMDTAKKEIKRTLNRLHALPEDTEEFVDIRDFTEIQNAIRQTVTTIAVLLGSIAVISLFVGGIGIMNIMLVSVTERTREIGLRKAIGAGKWDILSQFLIEAVVLTFTGGLLGIGLGVLTSKLISLALGWITDVTPFSILLSTGFSILVGVFFGLWPARKAASLNTIDALRYE